MEHKVPEHVPPHLVVNFNYYAQAGGDRDPHAAWKKLHQGPDIFYTPHFGGHWVITRGEDLKAIIEDHKRFSSRVNSIPDFPRNFRMAPIETDPPTHKKYKQLLVPVFAPSTIKGFERQARQLSIELIEGFWEKGGCEFVSEFALKMPIGIFMRLAGLPEEDRLQLLEWVETRVRNADAAAQERAQEELIAYSRNLVHQRWANPGTDFFSRIANAEVLGRRFDEDEVVGFFVLMLNAGLDTVSSSLGFIARFLADNPSHRQQLIDRPELIPNAVEELLRRFGVSSPARIVAEDLSYKGGIMKKGDPVLLPITLHGLDERIYPDWEVVDFERKNAHLHLVFGGGIHRCLGSFLARTELRVFFEEWLKRIPDFSVENDATVLTSAGVVNGTRYLPLRWSTEKPSLMYQKDRVDGSFGLGKQNDFISCG